MSVENPAVPVGESVRSRSALLTDPQYMGRTLAWALGVGLLVGASPHTSGGRLLPSLVGGGAAALAVVAFRLREAAAGAGAPTLAVPPLAAGTLAVAAVLFAPTLVGLFGFYTSSIWENGHGLFLPFAVAALARARLRGAADAAPAAPDAGDAGARWGWGLALGGAALAVVDSGPRTLHLSTLGLVAFLAGFSLLTLGARRTRALAAPLGLCLFLLPLPTSLGDTLGLQTGSAIGTGWILQLAGIPVLREGSSLTLPGGPFGVSANCSGFSAFYGGLALAAFLSACTRSWRRRALLLLAPWPLAIAANSVRTAGLIGLGHWLGNDIVHTAVHGLSGIAAFWVVVVGVALLADWRDVRETLG